MSSRADVCTAHDQPSRDGHGETGSSSRTVWKSHAWCAADAMQSMRAPITRTDAVPAALASATGRVASSRGCTAPSVLSPVSGCAAAVTGQSSAAAPADAATATAAALKWRPDLRLCQLSLQARDQHERREGTCWAPEQEGRRGGGAGRSPVYPALAASVSILLRVPPTMSMYICRLRITVCWLRNGSQRCA